MPGSKGPPGMPGKGGGGIIDDDDDDVEGPADAPPTGADDDVTPSGEGASISLACCNFVMSSAVTMPNITWIANSAWPS